MHMALRTCRPYKHPKTGVYWIKRRVPERLKDRLGKAVHQQTLGTKDPREAAVRFVEALADLNERWARLSAEPGRLTRKQRKAIAGEFRLWSIARREENPGRPEDLRREIDLAMSCIKPPGRRLPSPGAVVRELFDAFLEERGISVHPSDLSDMAFDCAHAEVSAKEALLRYALGDYSRPKDQDEYPTLDLAKLPGSRPPTGTGFLTVEAHWDMFVAQCGYKPGTHKAWKPVLVKLAEFLGRTNLATATPEEVGDWKDKLMASDLSKKTVRDTYVTATKAFYAWGVAGNKLRENPAANIKVGRVKSGRKKPSRDLHDRDACLILSEALRPSDVRTSPHFARAKRWVPWICACTGARVNEITQARRKDFRTERVGTQDVCILCITPDAGTVKNGEERDVVLHPHLIEPG